MNLIFPHPLAHAAPAKIFCTKNGVAPIEITGFADGKKMSFTEVARTKDRVYMVTQTKEGLVEIYISKDTGKGGPMITMADGKPPLSLRDIENKISITCKAQ